MSVFKAQDETFKLFISAVNLGNNIFYIFYLKTVLEQLKKHFFSIEKYFLSALICFGKLCQLLHFLCILIHEFIVGVKKNNVLNCIIVLYKT